MNTNEKDNRYYVYALLDPRKPGEYKYEGVDYIFEYEPFYIGKGCGNRLNSHFHKSVLESNCNKNKIEKIKSIYDEGIEPISIKIFENISEVESNLLEISLIHSIGRQVDNTGILLNVRNGGDGPKGGTVGKKTYKICPDTYKVLDEYKSVHVAAYENDIESSSISRCCLGRIGYVTRGGYIWSFNKKVVKKDSRKLSINMIDIDGCYIRTFESASEAAKFVDKSRNNIIDCCRGIKISSGGYLWEYNDEELKLEFSDKRLDIINRYKILQNINGVKIIHNSMKDAAIYNNISKSYVLFICKKVIINPTYYFEYYDKTKREKYEKLPIKIAKTNARKIIQIFKNNEIIHNSLKEAASYNNISSSTIIGICKGHYKSDRFTFEYFDKELNSKYKDKIKDLNNKKHGKKVEIIQLTLEGDMIKEWESITDASKFLNLTSIQHLLDCCQGRRKTAYGFKWVYKKDCEINI